MILRILLLVFGIMYSLAANALTLKKTTAELRTLIGDTISFRFDEKTVEHAFHIYAREILCG